MGADPVDELGALTGALRRHLARARRRGRRRLPASERALGVPAPQAEERERRPAARPPAAAPPEAEPAADAARVPAAARAAPPAAAAAPRASEPARGELFPTPRPARRPAPASPPAPAPPGGAAGWQEELERRVAAVRSEAAAAADLDQLRACVADCTRCRLARTRTQTVFADGAPGARVMFVGEGPGRDEDEQGVPFVGAAGQLLTRIIENGMGLRRSDVYIANVVKCRPPQNRDPTAQEKRICTGWLDRQIELVDPEVIVPLGKHAAGHVLSSDASMGRMRGRVHPLGGRKVVPTYHPAFLLRSPDKKRDCWADVQLAMAELGLERPPQG